MISKRWFVWLRRNWSNISSMQNRFLEILIDCFIFTTLTLHKQGCFVAFLCFDVSIWSLLVEIVWFHTFLHQLVSWCWEDIVNWSWEVPQTAAAWLYRYEWMLWASRSIPLRGLNAWQPIRVDRRVLALFLVYSRTCVLICRRNGIKGWWSRHLQRRQADVFRYLVDVFHRKQLFVIRSSRLTFSRRSFIECRAKWILAVCSLHRLHDLVFRIFIFVWQKVRDANAKLFLNDLISQLELFFEMFDDLVALFDVEFGAMLSAPDV